MHASTSRPAGIARLLCMLSVAPIIVRMCLKRRAMDLRNLNLSCELWSEMESVLASHNLQDCIERAALAILFDLFGHFLTNAKRLENAENIIIFLKIVPQKIKSNIFTLF
jgi:hypothetical protein